MRNAVYTPLLTTDLLMQMMPLQQSAPVNFALQQIMWITKCVISEDKNTQTNSNNKLILWP